MDRSLIVVTNELYQITAVWPVERSHNTLFYTPLIFQLRNIIYKQNSQIYAIITSLEKEGETVNFITYVTISFSKKKKKKKEKIGLKMISISNTINELYNNSALSMKPYNVCISKNKKVCIIAIVHHYKI